MNENIQPIFQGTSSVLHRTLEDLFNDLGNSSLVWSGNGTLFVSTRSAVNIATLPQASELCQKYLKLKHREVAITNDPYSGGTTLSDFTLVFGFRTDSGVGEAEFLLAKRISFCPDFLVHEISEGKSVKAALLDDEGVRVPPTPLGNVDTLNKDLLQAIAAHPKAPKNLFELALNAIYELKITATKISYMAQDSRSLFRKDSLTRYLEDSTRAFEILMGRLPLGTVVVTSRLQGGEGLKLKLVITEDHLVFDFGGSESSKLYALTELATFGACFAATVSLFDQQLPFNSGTFQFLQVIAPTKTMLSASAPNGTYRGMSEGASAVCDLARLAILRLIPNGKLNSEIRSHSNAQVKFQDGRILNLIVPGGSSATSLKPGNCALMIWQDQSSFSESMDQLEFSFPILLLSVGERANSGGKGKAKGGNGAVFGFQTLCGAELRWIEPSLGKRIEGSGSGKAGQQATIEIVRGASGASPGAREEIVSTEGRIELYKDDQVFLMSAGGGGFGETAEVSSAE